MKLISVIIPTFNRAHVLTTAIKSVTAQSENNWELIIVDDGSTDRTSEVVESFLSDQRIKYLKQKHSGVSIARNLGAKEAKADYLLFLDSDDRFEPDLFRNLLVHVCNDYDLICWNVIREIGNRRKIRKPQKLGPLYNNLKMQFLAGSVCYKKKVFIQAGGFDPVMSFGENYELGIRISKIGWLKTKCILKPFLRYAASNREQTKAHFNIRLQSHLHQYNKHIDLYHKNPGENGKMLRILGYVSHRSGLTEQAIKLYFRSWLAYPLQINPLLKIIYLKMLK